jgi:DNA-damage-inducible protein J
MAQTAFTVRMDSETKKRFDELCKDFGMSANTAFNVFARTVVKQERIPFEVESEKENEEKELARQFGEAFDRLREDVQRRGIPEMSLEEINEVIREVREERRKRKEGEK